VTYSTHLEDLRADARSEVWHRNHPQAKYCVDECGEPCGYLMQDEATDKPYCRIALGAGPLEPLTEWPDGPLRNETCMNHPDRRGWHSSWPLEDANHTSLQLGDLPEDTEDAFEEMRGSGVSEGD